MNLIINFNYVLFLFVYLLTQEKHVERNKGFIKIIS